MSELVAYFDHSNTLHVGPDACPNADAMGAALDVRQALSALRAGADLCSACSPQ